MTDKQRLALLRKAVDHLERTKQGHVQWAKEGRIGPHWKEGLIDLHKLENDLKGIPVPVLGPVWLLGKSVLDHDLTHATSGIPLYPAFDDAFHQGGLVIAPEIMHVIPPFTSSNPGEAFYAQGKSKLRYWFAHLDRSHPIGWNFKRGDSVGKVAANNIGGGPHVHVGINVELLLGAGKQLLHHTNYTHGAPTVGQQLRKTLA